MLFVNIKIKNILLQYFSHSLSFFLQKKLSANVGFCVLWCGSCILEPQIGEFLEYANFKNLFSLCCLALWRSPSNPTVIFRLNDSASKFFQSTILCWYIFHTNQGYIDRFAVQNLMDFFFRVCLHDLEWSFFSSSFSTHLSQLLLSQRVQSV